MTTFVDLGNMRAKLDTSTGQIRITSGEKDSHLRKSGFMVNIQPGSKEYKMLMNMTSEPAGRYASGEKVFEAIERSSDRAETLLEVRRWDLSLAALKSFTYEALNVMLEVYDFSASHKISEPSVPLRQWINELYLLVEDDETLLMNLDRAWHHTKDKHGKEILGRWRESLLDQDDDSISIHALGEARAIIRHVHNKLRSHELPKIVHLSQKYHSSIPDVIPLGVDRERSVFRWNARKQPHMRVVGETGHGKTMMLSSVLDHANRHKKHVRAVAVSANNDLHLPQGTLLEENIDVYDNVAEAIRKVHSITKGRFEYMEQKSITNLDEEMHNGKMKRLFFVLDDFLSWKDMSLHSPFTQHQAPDILNDRKIDYILKMGRHVGVHVAMSFNKEPGSMDLGGEAKSNIPLVIDLNKKRESNVRGDRRVEFKGFSVE